MSQKAIGDFIAKLAKQPLFQNAALAEAKKSAAGKRVIKETSANFATTFEKELAEGLDGMSEYANTEYELDSDKDGNVLVYITIDLPENYSPSLYPKGYPDGILIPRLFDTGFSDNGQHAVFGKWIKHGIFTYGLREREGSNYIQEMINEFEEVYGVEIQVNQDFYDNY